MQNLEKREFHLDTLSKLLFKQRKSPTFFPVSGTFKSLVAQGKIEIFSTNIKRELFNLYDTNYERTVYNGTLYDKIYVNVYDNQIQKVMDLKTEKIENLDHLKSKEFEKSIILIVDEAESYLKLLTNSRNESQSMLNLINKK